MKKRFRTIKDTGFSSLTTNEGIRLLNKDGSVSIKRLGLNFSERFSVFHWLINMSWISFFFFLLLSYVIINTSFAFIYVFMGMDGLTGVHPTGVLLQFLDAFYFSSQTLTTLGYGAVSPLSTEHNLVASFESFIGLLSFATSTGLLYGRFSKPKASTMFTQNALITPYKEGVALMIRIANSKDNQLINLNANLILSRVEIIDGKKVRKFRTLALEYDHINILVSSWTIVYPFDEQTASCLQTKDAMEKADIEILLQLDAYDETYSQQIHSRTSYKTQEIIWGAKFNPVLGHNSKNEAILSLDKFNSYELVELPSFSNLPTE